MRIDVVTIFPEYLAALELSLVGRAIETGLVDLGVHDLRTWTHDRHRTVDDTPYGGGAGMVMKPEPWGEALDALLQEPSDAKLPGKPLRPPQSGPAEVIEADLRLLPRLIVLSPSGTPLSQALAGELAAEQHLVLACGRYEGIDARVAAHARTRMRVDEVSIGDYVLNGGEAAALVLVEAVVRLIPGVIGNPSSLAEESHAAGHDGLLEYPVYTKPPVWRGLPVPEVLFSGHHGRIESWRREQAVALTRQRRPDLLPPGLIEITVAAAVAADAGELFTLQRAAFVTEAQLNEAMFIPALTDGLDEMRAAIDDHIVLVARLGSRLVGGVRGVAQGDAWLISRLVVAPDHQGRGIGSRLLGEIERRAPGPTSVIRLMTGARSVGTLAFYARHGYLVVGRSSLPGADELLVLEKSLSATTDVGVSENTSAQGGLI